MVVQGTEAAEVRAGGTAESVPTGFTPLGAELGFKVIVEGMAVTIPGFWGTQAAQIPVK